MGGGGGTSGKIAFPTYVETFHEDILDPDSSIASGLVAVDTGIANAQSSNPYSASNGAVSTDRLTETISSWYEQVKREIDVLDSLSDYSDSLDKAVQEVITNNVLTELDASTMESNAQADATAEVDKAITEAIDAVQTDVLDPLVNEFTNRVNSRTKKRQRRLSAVMADANAVHSSAFVIGHALLERDANREINRFDAELYQQLYELGLQSHVETFARTLQAHLQAESRNKGADDELVARGVERMYQGFRQDIELLLSERRSRQQIASADWEARQSAEEFEVKVDRNAALWDLTALKEGANILAAPSGMAATLPEEKSDTSKAIGGALTGGVAGAKAGSTFGPQGTAIGAGIGAILGASSGLLD